MGFNKVREIERKAVTVRRAIFIFLMAEGQIVTQSPSD